MEVLEQGFYKDTKHVMGVEEAYAYKDHFVPFSRENSSLGLTSDTVWVYLELHNPTAQVQNSVVELLFPWFDYLEVYYFSEGKRTKHYSTGDMRAFDTRPMNTSDFVFPYTLKGGERQEILFKIVSSDSIDLEMQFLSMEEHYDNSVEYKLLFGLSYGIVLIMLIYNLVLYFMIKDVVYLDYVIFHFVFLILSVMLNGLLFQYFYPQIPMLNMYLPILFLLAVNFFALRFEITFLELKRYTPKVVKIFHILMFLLVLTGVWSIFMPSLFFKQLTVVLSIVTFVTIYGVSIYMLFRFRTVASKFFVFAWSFIVFGALLDLLQSLGIIPSSTGGFFRAQLGALVELALFAFALAYRYNTLFIKLTDTQNELRTLNANLEEKVVERTDDLDGKNRQLSLEINNKNILLRELYHRVKNNLQIISGLLSIQSQRMPEGETQTILDETNQRIKSMAMIHEKLYQSDDFSFVDMQEYTQEMVFGLRQSFRREHLKFHIDCESIKLPLEAAVPIGLIINELVTNAIKYAFDASQTDQMITVKMYTRQDTLILKIFDNGKGVVLMKVKEGFGCKLVQSLAEYQLKADIDTFNDNGLHYIIVFPKGLIA